MKTGTVSRNQDGFTLVEVMIASVLIGFEMLAVLAMFGTAARGNAFSRRLTTAVNLAQTRIEVARNTPFTKRGDPTSTGGLIEETVPAANVLGSIGAIVAATHPVYTAYQAHVGHAADTFLRSCYDTNGTGVDCTDSAVVFTRWVYVCEQNHAPSSSSMSVDLFWKDAFRRQRTTTLATIIGLY